MAILASAERITAEAVPLEIRFPREKTACSSLEEARAHAERNQIRKALEQTRGNVSAAARALGIERTRLHKRIRALGLSKRNKGLD